jgi:ribonuclease P protein component
MVFLKKRADFLAMRHLKGASTKSFLAVRRDRADGDPTMRFGFTITKKIGHAVMRNRIRRRLREAVRAVAPQAGETGSDYVLIARPAAYGRAFPDLLDDLQRALLSLGPKST